MARGAVSAAKMMISDVPRLRVLVAVEERSRERVLEKYVAGGGGGKG